MAFRRNSFFLDFFGRKLVLSAFQRIWRVFDKKLCSDKMCLSEYVRLSVIIRVCSTERLRPSLFDWASSSEYARLSLFIWPPKGSNTFVRTQIAIENFLKLFGMRQKSNIDQKFENFLFVRMPPLKIHWIKDISWSTHSKRAWTNSYFSYKIDENISKITYFT